MANSLTQGRPCTERNTGLPMCNQRCLSYKKYSAIVCSHQHKKTENCRTRHAASSPASTRHKALLGCDLSIVACLSIRRHGLEHLLPICCAIHRHLHEDSTVHTSMQACTASRLPALQSTQVGICMHWCRPALAMQQVASAGNAPVAELHVAAILCITQNPSHHAA